MCTRPCIATNQVTPPHQLPILAFRHSLPRLRRLLPQGPGYRLGWLTAPAPLVGKLANWVMGSTVGPCSLSQVLVTRLLQAWGIHGFHSNLARLQGLYAERAAAANAAAATHLAGLATWHPVEAGMFMWIRLDGKCTDHGSRHGACHPRLLPPPLLCLTLQGTRAQYLASEALAEVSI